MLFMSVIAYGIEQATNSAHDFSAYVFEIATIGELLYLVLGVGAFFFGAHIIRQTKLSDPKA